MRKFNYNRVASIADGIKKGGRTKGVSIFYGDPVEISEEQAADVLSNQTPVQEVVQDAVAETAPSEEAAADRVAAYTELSRTEKSEVTVLPPLSLTNAAIIVKPVVKGISANNLNYLLQKAMVDYPALGLVKVATPVNPVEHPGRYAVEFSAADYVGEGMKAVPFFRFNLSASTLNARPGGNYNIWIEGWTENGQAFETQKYTFQRIETTQAVLGIMIPFRVIATRTLPALGIFGQIGDDESTAKKFRVVIDGMDPNGAETFTVTHPGYSTAETKVIAELFALPAGLAL